jgi:hypothetical protein
MEKYNQMRRDMLERIGGTKKVTLTVEETVGG